MQFTYRGHTYSVPAPVQIGSDATNQPKPKLIVWGNTIDYVQPRVIISKLNKTDRPTATFSYRGNICQRKI